MHKESLWEIDENLDVLKNKYQELFSKYKNELHKIKLIRNKLEHIPHKMKATSLSSGGGSSYIKFCYNKIYKEEVAFNNELKKIDFTNDNITKIINKRGKVSKVVFYNSNEEIYSIEMAYFYSKKLFEKIEYTEIYNINTRMLKNIIFDLNKIFVEIMKKLYIFWEELTEDEKDHPYFKSCFSCSFADMNNALESKDLYLISRNLSKFEDIVF